MTDHEGSVRGIVDPFGNNETDFVYDSFGRPAAGSTTPAAVDLIFGYAGGQFDGETGLQYHHHRYYDPHQGRFLSEDPTSFAGGDHNLYRYANGDPVNRTDPTGLAARYLGNLTAAITGSPALGAVTGYAYSNLLPDTGQSVSRTPSSNPFVSSASLTNWFEAGAYAGTRPSAAASSPLQIPLTERQGRSMLDLERTQQMLDDGVMIVGRQTAEARQAATGRAWGSEDFLTTWAYEVNYGLGRVLGESQSFPEIEPPSLRATRSWQDVATTTAAFAAMGASAGAGIRRVPAKSPSGFVPLADMESSAAQFGAPSGLSSNVAVQNGNLFNRVRAHAYQYSELWVEHASGKRYRVDGYNPGTDIVSRKFSQLADISETSAISYIREAATKYAPGTRIADVPSSGPLAGQQLQGQLFLEIPIQRAPVPQTVLDAAQRFGVLIRDVNGRTH